MSIQDLTTFVEVDPNNRFAVTSSRITFTGLRYNEDAYIYRDRGGGFFDTNFTVLTTILINATPTNGAEVEVFGIGNSIDDAYGVITGSGSELYIRAQKISAPPPVMRLEIVEVSAGSLFVSDYYGLSYDIPYYLKIVRDEAVGTYGTLSCYIYSDAARTILLGTLTQTLHSKLDYQYTYAIQSFNNAQTYSISGYVENLDIEGGHLTYPTDATTRVTGLVHRYSPGNYTLEIFLGGTETNWEDTKPQVIAQPPATLEPKINIPPVVTPLPVITPPSVNMPSGVVRTSVEIARNIPGLTPTYLEALEQATVASPTNTTPLTPRTANILANRIQDVQSLETAAATKEGAGVTTPAKTTTRTDLIIASLGGRVEAEKQRLAKAKAAQDAAKFRQGLVD